MGILLFENLLADLTAIVLVLFSLVVLYFNHQYKYWAKRKVPYLEPKFPYGNLPVLTPKVTFGVETGEWYREFKKRGHNKFGGVWCMARPALVVIDPEYVKDILSKDFNHFIDRDIFSNAKTEPISAHLFTIGGDEGWKNLRQKLTPTFTSGKMKLMFDSIVQCSQPMIGAVDNMVKKNQDISIHDVLLSFTADVIGNVAFGVECNSFDGKETEFKSMTKEIFKIGSPLRALKIIFAGNFPDLARKLRLRFAKQNIKDFFGSLVRNTAQYRTENHVTRPDFLQLLIDLKNKTEGTDNPFTFDQITANTLLFFIAGFDTSSTTMTFALFELAKNPDVQEKVRKEILEVIEKNNGQLTYESLSDMVYLRQVLDESMRLHPPVLSLGRICTQDYTLRDTDIVIEKGTPVAIPITGLHMDPEYFPNPEKFDPDRFSTENKANRHPFVHLPFGEGPRNCIGLRFGVMQSKIGLVTILRNFRLSLSPSTKLPLRVDPKYFLLKTHETIYLKAEKI